MGCGEQPPPTRAHNQSARLRASGWLVSPGVGNVHPNPWTPAGLFLPLFPSFSSPARVVLKAQMWESRIRTVHELYWGESLKAYANGVFCFIFFLKYFKHSKSFCSPGSMWGRFFLIPQLQANEIRGCQSMLFGHNAGKIHGWRWPWRRLPPSFF